VATNGLPVRQSMRAIDPGTALAIAIRATRSTRRFSLQRVTKSSGLIQSRIQGVADCSPGLASVPAATSLYLVVVAMPSHLTRLRPSNIFQIQQNKRPLVIDEG